MSDQSLKPDGEMVAAYLREHPDFYRSYPEVLEELNLPHGVAGSASLLEKQIGLLRDKNEVISSQIFQLVEIARSHESLSLLLHKIATGLITHICGERGTPSKRRRIQMIESVCKQGLNPHLTDGHVNLHWFSEFAEVSAVDISVIKAQDQRIQGLVNRLYANKKPECGPFSKPERVVLFPKFITQPMSAVVALLAQPDTEERAGLLVLTSNDPDRYVAGKGTMFLVQLVQLIECALTEEGNNDV